jgi:hypothetical protein
MLQYNMCVRASTYKSCHQIMEENLIVDWSQVHVGDVLMIHSNYMVTPTHPEGIQLKPLLFGWTIDQIRYPNLHIESLNDERIKQLIDNGAFNRADFRLPTLTGSIRIRHMTPLWVFFDTFNTITGDDNDAPISYKNFIMYRPHLARELFEIPGWSCFKQSSAHMAPVDAIESSNPYMIHTSIPAPNANPWMLTDPNPILCPPFTDKEMEAIGDLYRIPLRVREEAAFVSCIDFEYDWPRLLQTLPRGSVVRINKLFYGYVRENNHLQRVKMIQLVVPGTNDHMEMEYDALMHNMRNLKHEVVDISQFRVDPDATGT